MNSPHIPQFSEEAIRAGQQDILDKFGILFTGVEEGKASSEMALTDQHRNVYGLPYGGFLFHLADITAGMAFLSAGGNGVTVSGNVNFLRGASRDTKKLVCHAIVKKTGRKLRCRMLLRKGSRKNLSRLLYRDKKGRKRVDPSSG